MRILDNRFQDAPDGRWSERIHRNLEVLSKENHFENCHPPPLKFNIANHIARDFPALELATAGELILRPPEFVAQAAHLRTNNVTGFTFHSTGRMLGDPRTILPELLSSNCAESNTT